jgi:hypothetical protein
VNAYANNDPGQFAVIVLARAFRLPDVLALIEAGKIVLVIPAAESPPQAAWRL